MTERKTNFWFADGRNSICKGTHRACADSVTVTPSRRQSGERRTVSRSAAQLKFPVKLAIREFSSSFAGAVPPPTIRGAISKTTQLHCASELLCAHCGEGCNALQGDSLILCSIGLWVRFKTTVAVTLASPPIWRPNRPCPLLQLGTRPTTRVCCPHSRCKLPRHRKLLPRLQIDGSERALALGPRTKWIARSSGTASHLQLFVLTLQLCAPLPPKKSDRDQPHHESGPRSARRSAPRC